MFSSDFVFHSFSLSSFLSLSFLLFDRSSSFSSVSLFSSSLFTSDCRSYFPSPICLRVDVIISRCFFASAGRSFHCISSFRVSKSLSNLSVCCWSALRSFLSNASLIAPAVATHPAKYPRSCLGSVVLLSFCSFLVSSFLSFVSDFLSSFSFFSLASFSVAFAFSFFFLPNGRILDQNDFFSDLVSESDVFSSFASSLESDSSFFDSFSTISVFLGVLV